MTGATGATGASGAAIERLARTIAERARQGGARSYTRKLLDKGVAACAKKLGEEAVEAALAAVQGDRAGLRAEAADVIYHLLVLLEAAGVGLQEVTDELRAREGVSGLDEKAARPDG
jgi:phosphoribosyl-ATP pyrophosphohydrolase